MKWDQGYRILFVDDEKIFRRALLKWFSSRTNFALMPAADADEGFQLLEENSFDIVITNVRMPGMDGLAFTKVVKERYPNTPVIIWTAGDFQGERETAFRNGASARIFKPLGFEDLTDFIVAMLKDPIKFIGNKPGIHSGQ